MEVREERTLTTSMGLEAIAPTRPAIKLDLKKIHVNNSCRSDVTTCNGGTRPTEHYSLHKMRLRGVGQ